MAVKEQNIAIFATIFRPLLSPTKIHGLFNKENSLLHAKLKKSWLYYLLKKSARLFKSLLDNLQK